jgi:hypothetical protein
LQKVVCTGAFEIDPNYPRREQMRPPAFSLSATVLSSTSIQLKWKGKKCYPVFRNGVQVSPSSCGSFTDTGLQPGTAYTYTVNGVSITRTTMNTSPGTFGTPHVLLLMFEGYTIQNTSWNYAGPIVCTPSGLPQTDEDSILRVFTAVIAQYQLNVIVTTDESLYNATPATRRQMQIFTETHEPFGDGAGGMAFIGSNGTGNPSLVFTRLLLYKVHNAIFAGVHEWGHTGGNYHAIESCGQSYGSGANWMAGNYGWQVWQRWFGVTMISDCSTVNQIAVFNNTYQ